MEKNLILGIDTSNYTTSIAVVTRAGEIVQDQRIPLNVNKGDKGLRQSEALFQHVKNLPVLLEKAFEGSAVRDGVAGVSVSSRPRPVDGSYMPVFVAGVSFARTLGAAMEVPLFETSHQEGHLKSGMHGTNLASKSDKTERVPQITDGCCTDYLAWHISGGTCELLHVTGDKIHIVGGSKDISFGQLIDRAGVGLNISFPAGRELDQMACSYKGKIDKSLLKPAAVTDLEFNLSGLENQFMDGVRNGCDSSALAACLFYRMTSCLTEVSQKAADRFHAKKILFVGGVASSQFLRNALKKYLTDKSVDIIFGDPLLAADNAVGTALIGGEKLWQ